MKNGLFITFEGIDGCGKSTQIKRAVSWLSGRGMTPLCTREPGGVAIAEKIRSLVMAAENGEMCDQAELLLYLAARAQHVRELISPALDRGEIVMCDRFQEATFAYQGFGRGICLDTLKNLNSYATGGVNPDLTFIFDVSVDTARARLSASRNQTDRLESNSREFFQRVREGYLTLASSHPERVMLMQGELAIDELACKVQEKLESLIKSRESNSEKQT